MTQAETIPQAAPQEHQGERPQITPVPQPGPPPVPDGNRPAYYPQKDNFSQVVKWGVIGLVTLAGVTWLTVHVVKKGISNREQLKSLHKEDPASYAAMFKVAFENNNWWGTDTATVRQVFREIPSRDFFDKVAESYQRAYHRSLGADLKSALKSTEYEEMRAILDAKPKRTGGEKPQAMYDPYGWAKRIHAGVSYETWGLFWGTDLDAIRLVFQEIPTQKAWKDVKDAYASLYPGSNVEDDIDGDVSTSDFDFRAELKKKPYS